MLALPAHADRLCEPSRTRPDGDTFYIASPVRLYGVDAPEINQPLGPESRDHALKLMGDNKLIPFCFDANHGRRVCRVLVKTPQGSFDLGGEMLRAGLAYHSQQHTKDDPLYASYLEQMEKEAQEASRGVWGLPDGGVRPWDWRR